MQLFAKFKKILQSGFRTTLNSREAESMETLHRWRFLSMGFQYTRHWSIHRTSEHFSSHYKVYSWNLRERNHILRHGSVQRWKLKMLSSRSKTRYTPTDTFQYTHCSSCHPPGAKRGFIRLYKGEAISLLRTNSSEKIFQEAMCNFKTRLEARGFPKKPTELKGRFQRSPLPDGNRRSKNKTNRLKANSCLFWRHTIQGWKT